ncbi:MAG: CDP-alcohol phosphatidyltransferase family protein [Nanoarchaeota archaeon]
MTKRLESIIKEEITPANLVSLLRPIAAYIGLKKLKGKELSIYLGAVMLTDVLDGILARKQGPSPLGGHIDRISDHATEVIAYSCLGYPVQAKVHAVRDLIVDFTLAMGWADEKDKPRSDPYSKTAYASLKAAAFMLTPLNRKAGNALGLLATAVSLERALELYDPVVQNR